MLSTTPLTIQRAGPDEAAAVARIRVLSWQAAYPGLVPQTVLDAMTIEDNVERTRRRMTNSTLKVADDWLAWRGGDSLGWLGAGCCRDDDLVDQAVGEVVALYVVPEAWGQGVGHALVNFAVAEFRSLDYQKSVVWVMEGNTRAERFYERQGYLLDGARRPLQMKGIPGHLRRLARPI